jgi:hypothetical protein
MVEPDGLMEALDRALTALENGASLESVLAADPARAKALRPLLVAALAVGAGPDLPRVPAGAQFAHRAQFLAAAADLRAADARAVAAPLPARHGWPRLRAWLGAWAGAGSSLLARTVAVSLVVLAGLGTGGYGVVAASDRSLPGDPLYGVKRTVESTELLLASDKETRARLQAEFDDRRVREAQTVANQGRQVPVEFTGTLIALDGAPSQHWLVSGVTVLVGPQVPIDGVPVVGALVHIQGTVQNVGEVQAQHVTVLEPHIGSSDDTPTATVTDTASSQSPVTATPSLTPAGEVDTATETSEPTEGAPEATEEAGATATNSPGPAATFTQQATEDHGGGPGPSASPTPKPTDGGDEHGGTPTGTPRATENDDHGGSASPTPRPSPSNTPKPTDSGGGGGPLPSNTPRPTDDGVSHSGGSSPTPTRKPND